MRVSVILRVSVAMIAISETDSGVGKMQKKVSNLSRMDEGFTFRLSLSLWIEKG